MSAGIATKFRAALVAAFLVAASLSATAQTKIDLGTQARYGSTAWTSSLATVPSFTSTGPAWNSNFTTWTLNSNFSASRALGTAAAGSVNSTSWGTSFAGDAGGTTIATSALFTSQNTGSVPIVGTRGIFSTGEHSGSALATNVQGIGALAILDGTGDATNATGLATTVQVTNAGSITGTGSGISVSSPTMSGTGTAALIAGVQINNQGNAKISNSVGVRINEMTNSTVSMRGIQSSLSSGTGKNNLYIDGTAVNYIEGQTRFGSQANDAVTSFTLTDKVIAAANGAGAFYGSARFSADTSAAGLFTLKGRGTAASPVIVNSGDTLGSIIFQGTASATTATTGALIRAEVDGTPGATNDMPGRLVFMTTPDGSGTVAERWRIDNAGNWIAATARIPIRGTGTGASQLAVTQTTAPTCATNCGTSPTLAGSDTAFTLTMGATGAPASGFVVTFNGTWAAAPSCIGAMALAGMANTKLPLTLVTTTTTLTVVTNGAAPANNDKYHFHCMGVQ